MNFWTRRHRCFWTRPLPAALIGELNAAQAKVEGFDLRAYQAAHAVLIGAGGIGSQVAIALVRKGIGRISPVDDDTVEHSNLTRQVFSRDDVGRFKAVQLAKRLARDGLFATKIDAYPRRFQELLDCGHQFDDASVLICGVDNNPTRRSVTQYAIEHDIVVVHAGVGRDGNALYVMVQEPAQACWACAFPHYVNDNAYPCNLPGIIDVLQVVAGIIVYAVDSVLSGRHREWNVREIFLDGSVPDRARSIEPRPECPLCGEGTS